MSRQLRAYGSSRKALFPMQQLELWKILLHQRDRGNGGHPDPQFLCSKALSYMQTGLKIKLNPSNPLQNAVGLQCREQQATLVTRTPMVGQSPSQLVWSEDVVPGCS